MSDFCRFLLSVCYLCSQGELIDASKSFSSPALWLAQSKLLSHKLSLPAQILHSPSPPPLCWVLFIDLGQLMWLGGYDPPSRASKHDPTVSEVAQRFSIGKREWRSKRKAITFITSLPLHFFLLLRITLYHETAANCKAGNYDWMPPDWTTELNSTRTQKERKTSMSLVEPLNSFNLLRNGDMTL